MATLQSNWDRERYACQEARKEVNELSMKLEAHRGLNDGLEKEKTHLEHALEKMQEIKKKNETRIDELEKEAVHEREQVQELQRQIVDYSEIKRHYDERVAKLSGELEELTEEHSNLTKAHEMLVI